MEINIKNSQKAKDLNPRKIKKDLSRALSLLGLHTAELSVVFVNDPAMKRLNMRFRGKDETTDVLSFPMGDNASPDSHLVLGDIVISVPQALRHAKDYGSDFYQELLRLLLHGLLHLLGYDHEKSPYKKRQMEKKEKELLNALKTMD